MTQLDRLDGNMIAADRHYSDHAADECARCGASFGDDEDSRPKHRNWQDLCENCAEGEEDER